MSCIMLKCDSILSARNDRRVGSYWREVLCHFRNSVQIFRCREDITNDALENWEDIRSFLNALVSELKGDRVSSECLHVFRCIVSCTSCLENDSVLDSAISTHLVTVHDYKQSLSTGFMYINEKIVELKKSLDRDDDFDNSNKVQIDNKEKMVMNRTNSTGKDREVKLEYLLVYLDTLLSSLRWSVVTDVLSVTELNEILQTIQECVSCLDDRIQSVKLYTYKLRIHQLCIACFTIWLSNHKLYQNQCKFFFHNIQFWGKLFMEQAFLFFYSLSNNNDFEDIMTTSSDMVKDILDIFHRLHEISLSPSSAGITSTVGFNTLSLKSIMMEQVAKSDHLVITIDSNSGHDSQLIKNNDNIMELFEIVDKALGIVAQNENSDSAESAMCLCARWWQIIVGVLSYNDIESFLIETTKSKRKQIRQIRRDTGTALTKPLSSIFKLIQKKKWSLWPYVFSAWIFILSLYQDSLEKQYTTLESEKGEGVPVIVDPLLVKIVFKTLQPILANISEGSVEVIGRIDDASLMLASKCLELVSQMSWPDVQSVLSMEATGSSQSKVTGKNGETEIATVKHLLDSYLSIDHLPKNYDIKSSKNIDINGKEEDIDYNREILKSCIACRIIASLCYGAHRTLIRSKDQKKNCDARLQKTETGWDLFHDKDCFADYMHMSIRPYQTIFARGLFYQGNTVKALIDQAQLSYAEHKDAFTSILTFAKKCFMKMGLLLKKDKEQKHLRSSIMSAVTGLTRSWQMLINAIGRSLLRDFVADGKGKAGEDNNVVQSTQIMTQIAFTSQSVQLVDKEKEKEKENVGDEDEVVEYVVARNDPSVVEAIKQISQVFVPAFKNFWAQTCCTAYEDFRPIREMFLESMWWIMHRLTAYVFKLDQNLNLQGLCDESLITLLGTSINNQDGVFMFFWCVLLPTLHHCKGEYNGGGSFSRETVNSSSSSIFLKGTSESVLKIRSILNAIHRMRKGISEAKDLDDNDVDRSFAYLDLRVFISDFLANAAKESPFTNYIRSKDDHNSISNGILPAGKERRHTHVLLQDDVSWETKDGNHMILSQLWKGMIWACNGLDAPWVGKEANLLEIENSAVGLRSLLLTPFYLSNFGQGGFSLWLDNPILSEYKRLVNIWLTCEIRLVAPRTERGNTSTPPSQLTQLSQIASSIQTMICGGLKCSPRITANSVNSVMQSQQDLTVLMNVLDAIASNFHRLMLSKFWEEEQVEENSKGKRKENEERDAELEVDVMEVGSEDMMNAKVSDLKYFLRSNMMCCVLSWSSNVRDAVSDLCGLESLGAETSDTLINISAETDLIFPIIKTYLSTLAGGHEHWASVFSEYSSDECVKHMGVDRKGDNGVETVSSEDVSVYVDSTCRNNSGCHGSNSLHMDVSSNKTPPVVGTSSNLRATTTTTTTTVDEPYSLLYHGDCKYVIMISIMNVMEDVLSKCQQRVSLQSESHLVSMTTSSYILLHYRTFDTVLYLMKHLTSLQQILSKEELHRRVANMAESLFAMESEENVLLSDFPRKSELLAEIEPFKKFSSKKREFNDISGVGNGNAVFKTPSASAKESSATKTRKMTDIEADIVEQRDSSSDVIAVMPLNGHIMGMNVAVDDGGEANDNELSLSQGTAVDSDEDDLL